MIFTFSAFDSKSHCIGESFYLIRNAFKFVVAENLKKQSTWTRDFRKKKMKFLSRSVIERNNCILVKILCKNMSLNITGEYIHCFTICSTSWYVALLCQPYAAPLCLETERYSHNSFGLDEEFSFLHSTSF